MYNELLSQYKNSIPHDLIMNFIIADVPKNFITNETYNGSYYSYLECAGDENVLRLKKTTRNKYGFKNVTLLINPKTFANSLFEDFILNNIVGFNPVLINQILYGFDNLKEISIMDHSSRSHLMFIKDHIDRIDWLKNPFSAFFLRLIGIMRIIFGLFLASNITSLYFLIIIIGIPIFILATSIILYKIMFSFSMNLVEAFLRLYDHPQINSFREILYKTFPWLGIYLHASNLNNNSQCVWIFCSQIGLMIVFYCIYVSLFEFLDILLFVWSFPLGINLKFYILILVLEIGSFLFIRTRTSLKFFPKLVFLFLFMFCFYIQFNGYAFYDEAFYCLVFATLFFLLLFIIFLEMPALSWNPSYHYTPSMEKPRTLYNPLFSMAWYYDLPQLWTLFYPLHDRSTFTENEMALVDRKYLILNQLLNHQEPHLEEANRIQNNPGINNLEANSTIHIRNEEIRNRSENDLMDEFLQPNYRFNED